MSSAALVIEVAVLVGAVAWSVWALVIGPSRDGRAARDDAASDRARARARAR